MNEQKIDNSIGTETSMQIFNPRVYIKIILVSFAVNETFSPLEWIFLLQSDFQFPLGWHSELNKLCDTSSHHSMHNKDNHKMNKSAQMKVK